MAITTSQISQCDVVVKLDNGLGNLTDISGSTNRADMSFSRQTGEMSVFGSAFYVRQQCKKDAEISFAAVYSQADHEAAELLLDWFFVRGGAKTIVFDVPNSEPGSDRYTFEVLLTDLTVPLDSNDPNPILMEATLTPTGEFTRAVIGS